MNKLDDLRMKFNKYVETPKSLKRIQYNEWFPIVFMFIIGFALGCVLV